MYIGYKINCNVDRGRLIYGTCGSCRKMRERSNNKQASKNTQKRKEKADGSQATENSGH